MSAGRLVIPLKEGLKVIIAQLIPQGESHVRVKLYTEEGVQWATVFGVKNSRSAYKRQIQILSMGTMCLSKKRSNLNTVQDFELFESCYDLSRHYTYYNAAHALLELALQFESEENEKQFKSLAANILKLVSVSRDYLNTTNIITEPWLNYFPLLVYLRFLLQCLVAHGVDPALSAQLSPLAGLAGRVNDADSLVDSSAHDYSALPSHITELSAQIESLLQSPKECNELRSDILLSTLKASVDKAQSYLDKKLSCAAILLH